MSAYVLVQTIAFFLVAPNFVPLTYQCLDSSKTETNPPGSPRKV